MSLSSALGRRIAAFRYAGRGLVAMLRTEPHARFHALATAVVLGAGFGFGIERGEWLALLLAIGSVWTAEAFNTAFEALCDVASPGRHPLIERAKDVAAAAVLLAALAALAVGLVIFVPRILDLSPT